jgi:hypothetical protein
MSDMIMVNRQKAEVLKVFYAVFTSLERPAERWFMNIKPGDTAETSQVVAITLDWVAEFKTLLTAVRGKAVADGDSISDHGGDSGCH